ARGAWPPGLRFMPNLEEALAHADFVQENAPERADLKVKLFAQSRGVGPGLRWGVMGPSLQRHLGGGKGGIRRFAEHLMDGLVESMNALEMPAVTPSLKQPLIDGVLDKAGEQTVDHLAQEENEVLMRLLALRDGQDRTAQVTSTGTVLNERPHFFLER